MAAQAHIKVFPLGSGSKGNSTLVVTPDMTFLIDAGFSAKETFRRIAMLSIDPFSIKALLVTHEHSDHVRGLGPLARKLKVPVYTTRGTHDCLRAGDLPEVHEITPGETFELGEIVVEPIPLPHDAAQPVAFIMNWGGRRWALLTDFGFPTRLIVERLRACDLLLLEANHDEELLMNGPYPWPLKFRIKSRDGHLSNGQSVSVLDEILHPGLQAVALMHLSETNNRPELPFSLYQQRLKHRDAGHVSVRVAPQDRPLSGLELTTL